MHSILLQAAPSGGFGIQQIIMFGALILIFYFFMIRPQQKKAKDQKNFRESLKTGLNVVTIGGLHGKIITVEETTVTVEVDKGVKLTFDKSAIAADASARTTQK